VGITRLRAARFEEFLSKSVLILGSIEYYLLVESLSFLGVCLGVVIVDKGGMTNMCLNSYLEIKHGSWFYHAFEPHLYSRNYVFNHSFAHFVV
jgi:hypothetical protein